MIDQKISVLKNAFGRIYYVSILLRPFEVINCYFTLIFYAISKVFLNEKVDFTHISFCFVVDFDFKSAKNLCESARVTMEERFRKIIKVMLVKTWSEELDFISFCLFKKKLSIIRLEEHHFCFTSACIPRLWVHDTFNKVYLFSNVKFS